MLIDWMTRAVCRDHDPELWFPVVVRIKAAKGYSRPEESPGATIRVWRLT